MKTAMIFRKRFTTPSHVQLRRQRPESLFAGCKWRAAPGWLVRFRSEVSDFETHAHQDKGSGGYRTEATDPPTHSMSLL